MLREHLMTALTGASTDVPKCPRATRTSPSMAFGPTVSRTTKSCWPMVRPMATARIRPMHENGSKSNDAAVFLLWWLRGSGTGQCSGPKCSMCVAFLGLWPCTIIGHHCLCLPVRAWACVAKQEALPPLSQVRSWCRSSWGAGVRAPVMCGMVRSHNVVCSSAACAMPSLSACPVLFHPMSHARDAALVETVHALAFAGFTA